MEYRSIERPRADDETEQSHGIWHPNMKGTLPPQRTAQQFVILSPFDCVFYARILTPISREKTIHLLKFSFCGLIMFLSVGTLFAFVAAHTFDQIISFFQCFLCFWRILSIIFNKWLNCWLVWWVVTCSPFFTPGYQAWRCVLYYARVIWLYLNIWNVCCWLGEHGSYWYQRNHHIEFVDLHPTRITC